MKNSFYCQKVCGDQEFSIDEWNKLFKFCNDAGIEGIERDRMLSPELFPCEIQCVDCACIVGEKRRETKKLMEAVTGK